ncbi:MAG: FadR family transcriptional regulator [Halanaerobiales bacterium]|nr:FadR family transcriptional regulator [Halanaerobiales bacterium]
MSSVFEKLKKPLIYEKIMEQIKESVLKGELKPGDRLPSERKMTEMFGTSRMSLREALKSLSVLGLIESNPGEGYYISQSYDRGLSSLNLMSFYLEDVRFSVLETRLIIEPEAIKLAVERITPEQLIELEKCVEEMLQRLEESKPYLEPDEKFHIIIFEATQNVVLINMIKTLGQIIVEIPKGKESSAKDHKDILEAVKVKDKELAAELMIKHLCSTRQNLLNEIHNKVISEKQAFEK